MAIIGERLRWKASVIRHTVARLRLLKKVNSRQCNFCGYVGPFYPFGWPVRPEARCPKCQTVERHRLFGLWMAGNAHRFVSKHVLHFAPETAIATLIRPFAATHVTADIEPGKADIVLDIERLDLPEESFDAIICLHVIEHVDDARALGELYRVLRSGGFALLMTPVIEGWARTYENAAIDTPDERLLHFGQQDHVRYFGADVRDRIAAAGFVISEFTAEEPDVSRYGLTRGQKLFIARK